MLPQLRVGVLLVYVRLFNIQICSAEKNQSGCRISSHCVLLNAHETHIMVSGLAANKFTKHNTLHA